MCQAEREEKKKYLYLRQKSSGANPQKKKKRRRINLCFDHRKKSKFTTRVVDEVVQEELWDVYNISKSLVTLSMPCLRGSMKVDKVYEPL